jgi:hypothetical protein
VAAEAVVVVAEVVEVVVEAVEEEAPRQFFPVQEAPAPVQAAADQDASASAGFDLGLQGRQIQYQEP